MVSGGRKEKGTVSKKKNGKNRKIPIETRLKKYPLTAVHFTSADKGPLLFVFFHVNPNKMQNKME